MHHVSIIDTVVTCIVSGLTLECLAEDFFHVRLEIKLLDSDIGILISQRLCSIGI